MAEATVEEKIEADAEGEAPAEVAESKSSKKKLIIIAGAGVAVLLLASAGLYFTGVLDHFLGKKEAAAPAPAPKPLVFYDLPDFLVNLNSANSRRPNFLKLSVSLELESKEDTPRIAALLPRIVDNFQIYLRELRVEDLRGSDGIYRLREELLTRVATAAAPAKVSDVLFKEMLVQ